jgi:sirohydrochlorin ferrochelatase
MKPPLEARARCAAALVATLVATLVGAPLAAQSAHSGHAGHSSHAAPQAAAQTTTQSAQRTAATSPVPASKVGTILIAHGAGAEWNSQVERIAHTAKTGGPLEVAYLMGDAAKTHRFQDAVKALSDSGVSEIVVVPLLVSSHSGHYEQIRYLAGQTDSLSHSMMHHLQMSGLERPKTDIPIRVARALDDAPEMAHVLSRRALTLAKKPSDQALFLVGHGPNSAEDNALWMRNLRVVADSVRAATGFRDVRVGLVRDDAPAEVRAEAVRGVRELIGLQHELTGQPVVVVPVLISKGRVSREKFMADLAGLDVVYTGEPLLPSPELAKWIESRVRQTARGEVVNSASR